MEIQGLITNLVQGIPKILKSFSVVKFIGSWKIEFSLLV